MRSVWEIAYREKRCYFHEYRVSVSSVGVKCRYIVKGYPWPRRKLDSVTEIIEQRQGSLVFHELIVIRDIHNWFAYVSSEFHEKHPDILDISCFRVSRKYAYNVPVSKSHSAKKYQQRKHRPLQIHLINITVTRSRFGWTSHRPKRSIDSLRMTNAFFIESLFVYSISYVILFLLPSFFYKFYNFINFPFSQYLNISDSFEWSCTILQHSWKKK